MKAVVIEIQADVDWLALNAYRMTLEAIVRAHEDEPWGFSGEEAADAARVALRQFPGTFGPRPRP